MIDKEQIRLMINHTESLLQTYKNEYPKNMDDCWRKRTPFLVLAMSAILPFAFLENTSVIFITFAVVPFVMIVCLIQIVRNLGQFRRSAKTRTAVTDSMAGLSQYMSYSDVRQYCDKTQAAVETLNSQKRKMRSRANTISIAAIVASFVITIGSILISTLSNKGENINMDILGFQNMDTFEAEYIEGGNLDVSPSRCTFRIESSLYNDQETDRHEKFRLRALNLDIKGAKDDDLFIMKITDKNGVPKAFVPEFIFNGSQLKSGKGIISAPQDDMEHPFENFETLQSIRAGGLYFIVEKIN